MAKDGMGSIVPYFGGKRGLAPLIVEELGPHASYFEPFCGSMAVLLAKPRCPMETVVDLNDRLCNLAKVLASRDQGPGLYRWLRRVPASERIYLEACTADPCEFFNIFEMPHNFDAGMEDAARYFISSWLGLGGFAGLDWEHGLPFAVRFTPSGGSQAARWQSAVASIPGFRRRLRNVAILCRDAFGVIDSIADENSVAIYCDPPYLEKSAKYLNDFQPLDHKRLAVSLGRFRRARVVVSYYRHPMLSELYPGWHQRAIKVPKSLGNQAKVSHGSSGATEVLLLNGKSFAPDELALWS